MYMCVYMTYISDSELTHSQHSSSTRYAEIKKPVLLNPCVQ